MGASCLLNARADVHRVQAQPSTRCFSARRIAARRRRTFSAAARASSSLSRAARAARSDLALACPDEESGGGGGRGRQRAGDSERAEDAEEGPTGGA
eukprot:201713-Prymnesium_polylepis.1